MERLQNTSQERSHELVTEESHYVCESSDSKAKSASNKERTKGTSNAGTLLKKGHAQQQKSADQDMVNMFASVWVKVEVNADEETNSLASGAPEVMKNWRLDQERPSNFHDILYGDEKEEAAPSDDEEMNECGEDEDERPWTPEAPPYSPLTPPGRRDWGSTPEEVPSPSASPERSRSPIQFPSESTSPGVVLRIFDEDGVPLDDQDEGAFLSPDAHNIFVAPEGSGRGGWRGWRRRVRGRGRGRIHCGRKVAVQWQVGHPLTEIWSTDSDVPPELIAMAKDVIRRRHERSGEASDESESETDDDEFFDANGGDDSLSRLEKQNLQFEWSPMESFQGQEEPFRPKRTGSVYFHKSAYEAFRSYWDDEVLSLIVYETNRYASKITSASFQSEWWPTNVHEILCLFAFWMMLGIVKMPTVVSCFSVDPLLKTEVFRRIFTRRRYEMLTRVLQFVESDPATDDAYPSTSGAAENLDRLHRLRPIITHLNSKFQSNYILSKDICIDESLTLWKGRLDFKQYIRSKASKFGIKTFELCESVTGYLWSFIVYTGKQSSAELELSPGVLKSSAVVQKLMRPLLNKGYRLFMDNWYNSPLLARFLKRNGTDCVGTLRPTRRDVPVVINKAPLSRGQLIARHSGDVSVLSWQDKKRITMISTCHGSSTALPRVASRPSSRPVPYKPQVVLDYNKFMGGVDCKDQMLEPYLLERKRGTKWYMKLFKRLLNVSILNSRILLQSSTQCHQDHLTFRLQLVDSILTDHLSHCPVSRRFQPSSARSTHKQPGRISHNTHWPVLLEATECSSAKNRKFWKRCHVCLREGRKSQKTSYCCESCRVPLCIVNCFKSYHTSPE